MTARRQERYGGLRLGIAVIASLGCALLARRFGGRAATSERVVVDRYTGLAIGGFDPVAFFTDARPVQGDAGLRGLAGRRYLALQQSRQPRFFIANPDVYSPRFGGYDPVDIARGVTCAGTARFWLIFGQRLYLFGHEGTAGFRG